MTDEKSAGTAFAEALIDESPDALLAPSIERLIVETALDAVITIGAAGFITGWSAQAEVFFGWTRAEAIGRPLSDTIIPERYREAHRNGLQRYLATGEGPALNQRMELSALRRDRSEFPVELAITPIRQILHRQRLQHSLRVVLDCPQESLRRPCWLSSPLLPVAQRSNIHVKKLRELRLAQARDGANLLYLRSIHIELTRGCPYSAHDLVHLSHAVHQPLEELLIQGHHSALIFRNTVFSLGVRSSLIPFR